MACVFVQEACKAPAEVKEFAFDLTRRLERRWQARAFYSNGQRIRPERKRAGFEYEAGGDGQTGLKEPGFPATLGETVVDGSITWTCRAISNSSLSKTISNVAWTVPAGLTHDDDALNNTGGRQEISITLSGGTAGATYLVVALVTYSDGTRDEIGLQLEVEAAG